MLTMMRALLRTKAAGLLFLLLIAAMAAWGVTDVFGGGLGKNLVGAGNKKISVQQFDTTVELALRSQRDERDRSITKEQALDSGLIDQLFQRELTNLALRAYADSVGLTATKDAVKAEITTTPIFLDTTGVFDPTRYAALLDDNRLSPAGYQDDLEKQLTINRLLALPDAALKAPGTLARIEAAFANEQRNADWFILSKSQLPAINDPTDEDLTAMFEERAAALREPERRQISLIRISPDDFLSQADVTDEDVEAFYQAYKAERYTGPDSRRFTEFNFADEASARAALGRIAGGAQPDTLDGLSSVQERTGRQEAIGNQRLSEQVFQRGSLTGGIYGPQPIDNVWTIIRLEDIIPGDEVAFELVKAEIFDDLAREQAIGLYYEAVPRFDDLIGTGADLESIGLDLGVPVLTFAPVDQSGLSEQGTRSTVLLEAPELIQKIFGRPEGGTTERLGDEEVTWMGRVDRIVPERAPAFEEVREILTAVWMQDKAAAQLQETAADIERAIASGDQTLALAAAEYVSDVQSLPAPLTRVTAQANLPAVLIRGLFNAKRTGDILTARASADAYVIMQVTEINRTPTEALALLSQGSASTVQNDLSSDLFQAFFAGIQGETDLKINEAALASYKSSIVPQQ